MALVLSAARAGGWGGLSSCTGTPPATFPSPQWGIAEQEDSRVFSAAAASTFKLRAETPQQLLSARRFPFFPFSRKQLHRTPAPSYTHTHTTMSALRILVPVKRVIDYAVCGIPCPRVIHFKAEHTQCRCRRFSYIWALGMLSLRR